MKDVNSKYGLIGLAVMGQNLALNIADHGFKISVYNRTYSKTLDFLNKNEYCNNILGFETLETFVLSIQKPRKIIVMVQAGPATDAVISGLIPLLDHQDIIIDGGNAKWTDTIRREGIKPKKYLLRWFRSKWRRGRCSLRSFPNGWWVQVCMGTNKRCMVSNFC